MKIAIFTTDHIYANKIVKDTITAFGSEIKLLVESDTLLPNRTKFQALIKYLKVSGFYYVFIQILKLEIFKGLSLLVRIVSLRNSKFYSYKLLAKKSKIKMVKVKDVSRNEFIRVLNNLKPDLIISIYFNQIISQEIIDIPKKGVINIHPAYLPDYKGVSPVFWALANSEKYAGVTVHYINKGVDTGSIIERKKVKIGEEDTEHSLYWKICKIGSPILIRTTQRLKDDKLKTSLNIGGRYFSLPSKEAVSRFRRERDFFNLKDYFFG